MRFHESTSAGGEARRKSRVFSSVETPVACPCIPSTFFISFCFAIWLALVVVLRAFAHRDATIISAGGCECLRSVSCSAPSR